METDPNKRLKAALRDMSAKDMAGPCESYGDPIHEDIRKFFVILDVVPDLTKFLRSALRLAANGEDLPVAQDALTALETTLVAIQDRIANLQHGLDSTEETSDQE